MWRIGLRKWESGRDLVLDLEWFQIIKDWFFAHQIHPRELMARLIENNAVMKEHITEDMYQYAYNCLGLRNPREVLASLRFLVAYHSPNPIPEGILEALKRVLDAYTITVVSAGDVEEATNLSCFFRTVNESLGAVDSEWRDRIFRDQLVSLSGMFRALGCGPPPIMVS
jgi:hypothetical protein